MARRMPRKRLSVPSGSESPPPPPSPQEELVPRILQRSGPSSLVVSLPKDLVDREVLSAGQFVYWSRDEDGDLRLRLPERTARSRGPREILVRLPQQSTPEQASRILLSSYVLGYDRVRIEDPNGLADEMRSTLERTAHDLLGFTLTEGSKSGVVATSFLDPTAHPVPEVVSRIGYALDILLEQMEKQLTKSPPTASPRVASMRVEVRRLHALTLRQLNLAAGNPRLARQLGVHRASHLLGTRVVTQLLEDIAEASQVVALELDRMRRPPSSVRPILGQMHDRVATLRERLRLAIGSLRSGNPWEAERVLESRAEALDYYLATEALLRKLSGPTNLRHSLSLCSWWIGVARQHAEAIAEVAFTRSLDRSPSILDLSETGEKRP